MDEQLLTVLRENPQDLLVLSAWYYKLGSPIISDVEYNTLAKELSEEGKDLKVVWDEVDEPIDLMRKYGLTPSDVSYNLVSDSEVTMQYLDTLADAGTKSCYPCYNLEDVYQNMMNLCKYTDELVMSLKVDGVSTRNVLEEEHDNVFKLKASLSRSRESRGFDYTKGMQLAVPQELTFNSEYGTEHERTGKKVILAFGEAYVKRTELNRLRKQYGKEDTWKTPRSTALSFLRDTLATSEYHNLIFKCFKLNVGDTLTEMFEVAEKAGLDVVPYELYKTEDIPKDRRTWEVWFKEVCDKFFNIQNEEDIEADGIVISINNQTEFSSLGESTDGRYNNAMFSCKAYHWGSKTYSTKVKEILFENKGNTAEFSVIARVEPVTVEEGNTVTRVNCFNPRILVMNNINIGSEIEFEYKGASSIVLKYKNK